MKWNLNILPYFLLIMMLGAVSSCFSDEEFEDVVIIRPDPKEIVNASVSGLVVDENERPLANVTVTLAISDGTVSIQTDDFGHFLFIHQQIPESAYLVFEQEGKFTSRRRIPVLVDQIAFVEVQMTEKTILFSFQASEGIDDLMSISPNIIANSDGTVYNGRVDVSYMEVWPGAPDFSRLVFGDLSGVDDQGDIVALISLGMINVELFSETGQQLDFLPGETAVVRMVFDRPVELGEVPLWQFNNDLGIWLESGIVSNPGEGRGLVGRIDGTGMWNFDYKEKPIDISGKIRLVSDGQVVQAPVGYLQVFLSIPSELGLGSTEVGGYVMSDQRFLFNRFSAERNFTLKVKDDCGNVLFSAPFGPFDADVTLNDIDIVLDEKPTLVSGQAANCDAAPIQDGIVQMEYASGKKYLNTFSNGNVSVIIDEQFNCGESGDVDLRMIDRSNGLSYLVSDLSLADDAIELNTVNICNLPDEFIEYKIEGENHIVCANPLINLFPEPENSNFGCGSDFLLTVPSLINAGIYEEGILLYIVINGVIYDHVENVNFSVLVNNFGNQIDDIVSGTISGQVRKLLGGGNYGEPVKISGSFRIKNK